MFCPKCAQQQIPDDGRFCSRCGFHLAAVSQLLRTEGVIFFQPKQRLPLIKRPELRKGAQLIFLSVFSVIPSFILAVIVDHPIPLIVPFIAFLVGLAQILYYFFFGESILPIKTQNQPFPFYENQQRLNYQPAESFHCESRGFNTAEFVQPPSITEPTANLYKNKT